MYSEKELNFELLCFIIMMLPCRCFFPAYGLGAVVVVFSNAGMNKTVVFMSMFVAAVGYPRAC